MKFSSHGRVYHWEGKVDDSYKKILLIRMVLFATVPPSQAQPDQGAKANGTEDEDVGYRDGDPGNDDEAGGDDGSSFGARNWKIAES
jgi:hypothetical protein